jgi:hypothetical protein
MKVYVNLIYTIAVDVDPTYYDVETRAQLIEAAAKDQDFYEHFPKGPKDVIEMDWEVIEAEDWQLKWLDDAHPFFTVETTYINWSEREPAV